MTKEQIVLEILKGAKEMTAQQIEQAMLFNLTIFGDFKVSRRVTGSNRHRRFFGKVCDVVRLSTHQTVSPKSGWKLDKAAAWLVGAIAADAANEEPENIIPFPVGETNQTPAATQMPDEDRHVAVTRENLAAARFKAVEQSFAAEVKKIAVGRYRVYSETSGATYEVSLNRSMFGTTAKCNCPSFQFRQLEKNGLCKHLVAAIEFEKETRPIRFGHQYQDRLAA